MIKQYITILNLLLIAGVVYFCVDITYLFFQSQESHPPTGILKKEKEKTNNTREAASMPLVFYSSISSRNIFNIPDKSKISPVDFDNLKKTELKLKLIGTVADRTQKDSRAIIEDITAKSHGIYRVGQAIKNAVLKIILREKVVLNVDGRDEILEMKKDDFFIPKTVLPNYTLNRSEIMKVVKKLGSLLKRQKRINAYKNGFKLKHVNSDPLFSKMGLKNNDIITSINKEQLKSSQDVFKIYNKLKALSSLTVQVRRNSILHTFHYSIK